MTTFTFMQIDAGVLLVWVLCCLILAQEDGSLTRLTRIPVLVVGAFAFMQALWLLGVWVPSAAGYPLPRLGLDIAVAAAFMTRTVEVLVALRKNSGRLFTVRPFGVTKRSEGDHGPARTS